MGNMRVEPPNWEDECKRSLKKNNRVTLLGIVGHLIGLRGVGGAIMSDSIERSNLLKIPEKVSLIYYDAITNKLKEINMTPESFNNMGLGFQIPYFVSIDMLAKKEIEKKHFHRYRDILGVDGNELFFNEMRNSFSKITIKNNNSSLEYMYIIFNIEANMMDTAFFTKEEVKSLGYV